uniref:Uncharacterized protein n=1 Tax=Panagrellus redivivus TaxID=6233 RepID=A0A7E4V0V2_PANRE
MSSLCIGAFKIEHASLIIVNIYTILTVILYFTNVPLFFLFGIPAVTSLLSYCFNQHRFYLPLMFMQTFILSFTGLAILGMLTCFVDIFPVESETNDILLSFRTTILVLFGSSIILAFFCSVFAVAIVRKYLAAITVEPNNDTEPGFDGDKYAKASAPPATPKA